MEQLAAAARVVDAVLALLLNRADGGQVLGCVRHPAGIGMKPPAVELRGEPGKTLHGLP